MGCSHPACSGAERQPEARPPTPPCSSETGRQVALLPFFVLFVCAFGRAGSSLPSGPSSGCGARGRSPAPLASPAADHGRCVHGLQRVWPTGLAVSRRAGSSSVRGQNRVSFIGRRILYRQATREAPPPLTLFPFVPHTRCAQSKPCEFTS